MNKEIKFLMKFDTSEFDKAVENMQRKLKDVYRPADIAGAQKKTNERLEGMGLMGGSKVNNEAYLKSIHRSRQEMESLISKYSKDQQSLLKDIASYEKALQKNLKLQESVNKGSERELQLLREKKNIEENLYRQRESWMARNQTLNQAMDARQNLKPQGLERLMTAMEHGGLKGGATAATRMGGDWWKSLGMTGQAGMVIAGLLAAAKVQRMVGDAAVSYNKMPLGIAAAQGSATQNTYGHEIGAIYGGTQTQEMAFMPEKQKAAGMAGTAQESQKFWDKQLGVVGQVGGGGGLGGAVLGLINDAFNERSRAYDLSKLPGGVGKRFGEKFESMQAEEFASNYAKATEDLKNQNPLKKAAVSDFGQRAAGDLSFQRATGLDYNTFHGPGGFRERSLAAGFTDQQGMEAGQGILGAGGSTRGARGLSVLSMQAQRGMDLTNANSVIGKLSGNMGSSESSRQAFITMLAEGSRLGLDASQFREENRRFMDAASSVIQESGTRSQPDIENLLKMFGGFAGDKTPAGMEKAKSAYDMYVSQTSQTAGPQGAMRAGAFLRSKVIGSMSGQDMAKLAAIDSEHATTDNPIIQGLAQQYYPNDPKGAQKIVDAHRDAGFQSLNRTGRGDTLRSKLIKLREEVSKAPPFAMNQKWMANKQQEIQNTENQFIGEMSLQDKTGKLANDPIFARQYAAGVSQPGGRMMTPDEYAAQQDKLGKKETGRPEDTAQQAAAESAKVMLKAFQDFHEVIVPSAAAVAVFNTNLMKAVDTMMKLAPEERAKFMQSNVYLRTLAPSEQSTGSKDNP